MQKEKVDIDGKKAVQISTAEKKLWLWSPSKLYITIYGHLNKSAQNWYNDVEKFHKISETESSRYDVWIQWYNGINEIGSVLETFPITVYRHPCILGSPRFFRTSSTGFFAKATPCLVQYVSLIFPSFPCLAFHPLPCLFCSLQACSGKKSRIT